MWLELIRSQHSLPGSFETRDPEKNYFWFLKTATAFEILGAAVISTIKKIFKICE